MLQDASWVKDEAEAGLTTPTYAYARNNPLRYTDPTGLYSWITKCDHPYGPGMDTLQADVHYPGSTVSDSTGCLDCQVVSAAAKQACAFPVVSQEYCACAKKLASEVCSTMGKSPSCKLPPPPKKLPQKENPRPICEAK